MYFRSPFALCYKWTSARLDWKTADSGQADTQGCPLAVAPEVKCILPARWCMIPVMSPPLVFSSFTARMMLKCIPLFFLSLLCYFNFFLSLRAEDVFSLPLSKNVLPKQSIRPLSACGLSDAP